MDQRPVHQWPAGDAAHLLVYPQQMQAIEQALFSAGMPRAALMEKAVLALSRRVLDLLGSADAGWGRSRPVVILIGPGHNGGDGAVLARELHMAGRDVVVWSPFPHHKPLTAAHLQYLEKLGVPRLPEAPAPGQEQLWIDALFGLGQCRPLPAQLAALAREARLAGSGSGPWMCPAAWTTATVNPWGPVFIAGAPFVWAFTSGACCSPPPWRQWVNWSGWTSVCPTGH